MGKGRRIAGLAAGLALLAAAPAAADVREWDAGGETPSWDEPANWSGDVVPGAGDVARIVVVESGEWPQIVSDVTVARLEHVGYGLDILGGTLTVTDGAQLAGEQLWVHEGGRLRLGGESTWERGALSVGGGVVGEPGGTLEVPAGATLRASGTDLLSGAQGGRLVLGGKFEAVGGEPSIGTPVELAGSIRATGGRLWLYGRTTGDGALVAGAGARLVVDWAQLTGSGGVTGAGTVEVSDALLLGTGTPYDVGRTELTYGGFLALGDGTVGRTGGLDAVPHNGFLPSVEGDLEVGAGPSRLGGITFDDGDVSIAGELTLVTWVGMDGGRLDIDGAQVDAGRFVSMRGGVIVNHGELVFGPDSTGVECWSGFDDRKAFINDGSVRFASNYRSVVECPLRNLGSIAIEKGRVAFTGDSLEPHTGSISVAAGALAEVFGDLELGAGSSLTGPGEVLVVEPDVTLGVRPGAVFAPAALAFEHAGELRLDADASVGRIGGPLNPGVRSGAGTLTITGQGNDIGGLRLTGPGRTVVSPGATARVAQAVEALAGHSLDVRGRVAWNEDVTLGGGAELTVAGALVAEGRAAAPGSEVVAPEPVAIHDAGGGHVRVVAGGELGATAGGIHVAAPLESAGTLFEQGGGMRLDDAVQTGGSTRIAAALSGRLRVAGGELLGTGAVAAEVVNSGGTVRPGGLVFTGRFVQGSGGRLVLAVGDVLRGADITLGGLLRVEGADATLQPGARIEVVRATGSRTGTFAAVESVPTRRLGVEYGPSVVALVVEPPETTAPTDQPPSSSPPSSSPPDTSPPASSSSSPGLKAVRLTGARCIRGGRIRLRLRVPSGAGVRRAIVHRSGRRVAVLGPRMVRRSLTLRVRGRRAVIRVTLIGAGARRALVRRYRRCA